MKPLLIVTVLSLVSCLPQEKGRSAGVEERRVKAKPCAVHFESELAFPEIAGIARKMKIQCSLSDDEILEKAREVYN